MISKELLSEVLGFKIENCWVDGNLVVWREDGMSEINIYELAHKCKQWALNRGYVFSIYSFNFSSNTEQEHRIRLLLEGNIAYYGNDSCEESEPEAIFKACEWILNERNI